MFLLLTSLLSLLLHPPPPQTHTHTQRSGLKYSSFCLCHKDLVDFTMRPRNQQVSVEEGEEKKNLLPNQSTSREEDRDQEIRHVGGGGVDQEGCTSGAEANQLQTLSLI